MKKLIDYAFLGLLFSFVVLGIFSAAGIVSDLISPPADYKKLYETALTDSETYRTKAGLLETRVTSLEASEKDFLRMVAADTLTGRLQETVKKSKGKVKFAAAYTGKTSGTLTGKTEVKKVPISELSVIPISEVKPDSLPTYRADLSNNFIDLEITAGPDSTIARYSYVQMLDIWHTYERPLFKPWKTVTYFRDLNPYAESQEIKTYSAPAAKPRRGIWFLGGVVAAGIAGIYIAK